MEKLICESLLWKVGLSSGDTYNQVLHEIFMHKPDCSLLLELEYCSFDCDTTFDLLQRHMKYDSVTFDNEIFGKYLLESLKRKYFEGGFTIQDFGKKCYLLWRQLPDEINTIEPFHALSYADDPLSWNDEPQTRKIFESFFDFYK